MQRVTAALLFWQVIPGISKASNAEGRRGARSLSDLKRTVLLVWRSAPGWTLAEGVLLLIQGVLPIASLYLIKLILDSATACAAAGAAGGAGAISRTGWLIATAAGVGLLGALCAGFGRMVTEVQSQTVTDHVLDLLNAKSLEADLEYYESARYYDTLHMAQMEAPFRPPMIVNGLVQILRSGISLVAVMALLFAFHWALATVLVAVSVPGLVIRFRFARAMYRWQRNRTPTERETGYYSWMMTSDAHAKENRMLGLGRILRDRFLELRTLLRRERMSMASRKALLDLAAQTTLTLAGFGLLLFMALRTARGELTIGHLVMVFMAFQRGQGFVSELTGGLVTVYENSLFTRNFYAFLDLAPRVMDPAKPVPAPTPFRTGIRFEGVSFRYPDSDRPALEDVSLTIRPGEHVALVGENGAGKTMLVKLLCRLYDPAEGRITVDGTDIRDISSAEWRRRIGVLFQDYAHYQLTARENIWLGDVELQRESGAIENAARAAGADSVIRTLSRGYNARLGKWFEDGEELSIGQWQKIALARCFLRQSDLVILDEPTSALDARAEHEVIETFHRIAAGRTTVIISHRMSTVRAADRILVLDGGRMTEQGTHAELMARSGVYARLFSMQASHYRE